ncbi:MAG: hypothetical protein JW864_09445 [Spirochaetes bacterium]|nr:hypothetical protein [Spirochaetota bacterium]
MNNEKTWANLSPEEKREKRFERWMSPEGINFNTPEIEQEYKKKIDRFIKSIKLEEPDRVPVMTPAGFFPAFYGGGSLKSVMYDYDELKRTWFKYINDFELDTLSSPALVMPGRMLETLDYKLERWPGNEIPDDSPMFQHIEEENMTPEEYDDLIMDPTDFLLRKFLPRTAGALSGLSKLPRMTPMVSIPNGYLLNFGDPDIRKSIAAILEAAEEGMKWRSAVGEIIKTSLEYGVPGLYGVMSGAPFDLIGDTLRGTKGIMMDMYKRPDKLLEAMERITPIAIREAVDAAEKFLSPVVFMPLHKGTGGFMSDKQFRTFYWPGLKKVMEGLINEGLVPMPFAEGDYNPRLEVIKDMPRASVIWYFETMNMENAKKVLGDNACIAGNLAVSILCTGTPEQVKQGCKDLIEKCAAGGGYILTGSAGINRGNPENLHAMMDAAKEYGVYRKESLIV